MALSPRCRVDARHARCLSCAPTRGDPGKRRKSEGAPMDGIEKFGIGQPVRRKEDVRFITGRGRFTDDVNLDGQAWGHVVRSPHAHAVIRPIDTAEAAAAPGVVAVLTGRDAEIGRASCRERVCQYVYSSVVAVS